MTEPYYMPHAGHLIVSHQCRFHLNTYVNGYIVSTVGEWVPNETVQNIMAESRGLALKELGDAREQEFIHKNGFEEIGCGRKYETMVFGGELSEDACCPYRAVVYTELECEGYNDAGAAASGHRQMVEKYSKEATFVGTK